ncbi:uncharacterized protein LOC126668736 [Mercurialis annua]|uniref:uncharacterized protein LOC126668736 n=1 Tax=Mercurialis annua TaxID=3986 RepID=UPI00215F7AA5|nr:uncharacterized protein LOC126668736 [Mercurialis annua]
MAVICWRIWIARNDKCFNNSEWTVSEVNSRALAQLHEFSSAHVLNNQSSAIVNGSTRQVQRWRLPPPGMIKINFDAALSISNRIAAVGLVCSYSSGYITYSCSHRFPGIVSPEIAEALGMRHAIMIASQLGLRNTIIEGDCLNVISAAQGKKDIPSTIEVIIFDTVRLSSSFIFCDFAYVKRMCNWMAYENFRYIYFFYLIRRKVEEEEVGGASKLCHLKFQAKTGQFSGKDHPHSRHHTHYPIGSYDFSFS